MAQFYPYDECSQAFIDEENNLWSYDGIQWHPRIGDPRMARKKKEEQAEIEVLEALAEEVYPDQVNRPAHYTEGRKIEPIDVLEDWGLDFRLSNVIKYVSRAGRKDRDRTKEDLLKAKWYLERYLAKVFP